MFQFFCYRINFFGGFLKKRRYFPIIVEKGIGNACFGHEEVASMLNHAAVAVRSNR